MADRLVQVRDLLGQATCSGSGKVCGLAGLVETRRAGLVIADAPLASPGPLVRRFRTPDGPAYAPTDTAGFIHRLQHRPLDASCSTREEVAQADLASRIVDALSPEAAEHIAIVRGGPRDIDTDGMPEPPVPNETGFAESGHTAML